MSEKVKLPKEVAEAVEILKTQHFGDDSILFGVLGNTTDSEFITLRKYAQNVSFKSLLRALVNGYEIEGAPITLEITTAQIKSLKSYYTSDCILREYKVGLRDALETIGLKVEGITS